ncbi:MAG: hypothetical protein KAS32_06075, partial [Candidatus Peribacteraceae bacterium]|nr:hypothetical protein [Candidatus Peribacteraceae bacterium]
MKKLIFIICSSIVFSNAICGQDIKDSILIPQMGFQESEPKVFAPTVICKLEEYEFGSALSNDYTKVYFGVRLNENWKAEIRYSKK